LRRWLNPQTVPRGFLRLYILVLLSRGPENGYSIMRKIEDRTDGAWRPGAGTIYPLLKALQKERLARAAMAGRRQGVKAYELTPRGRREIDEIRKTIAGAGRREPVMGKLFSDLLPSSVFVPMVIRRYREGAESLRQKVMELPPPERETMLKELRLLAEAQIQWIDRQLS